MFKKINWPKALSIVGLVSMVVNYVTNFIKEKVAQKEEEELIQRIADETSKKVIEGIKSV